jgi:hypothetical protein
LEHTYSTHGESTKCIGLQHFGCEVVRSGDLDADIYVEDLGVDEKLCVKVGNEFSRLGTWPMTAFL